MDEENETEVDEDTDINVNAAEESDHETESELEGSSDDEILSDDSGASHPQNFYLGKDNVTKWKKTRPNLQVRIRSHNIIKLLPGTKGNARNVETVIECLNLFVNDSVIRIITVSTNLYIQKVRVNFQEDRMNQDARETDDTEIRAFIGILFLIGALRSSRKNLHKIWDNSQGNGVESCYLAMSEKRFRFLIRCLRFDDINTRQQRRAIDKLAPIRELFEVFLVNFQSNFIGSEFLTVDEQLLAFRGCCAFKQYIPSKPAKFGIKTFAMVDAKTSYTFNLETYVGTQPHGPYKLSNSAEEITLRLVEPVAGTNRNITGDNWFSNLSLVNNLLKKKLTYLGTVRKNKREVPKEFLPRKNRKEKSSIFGFQENCTLVSYCPKKNRSVILISSIHHDNAIDEQTKDEKKTNYDNRL